MQPGQSEGNNERVPWPSLLGLTREARGVDVVNSVLDEVLQEVPRPTASISQEKVPLRNQIPWTNVPEQEREDVLDQEFEMDLAIQEHLSPKGGEVSHSQHITVSGPLGTRIRDFIPECYLSGMVHSSILYDTTDVYT